MEQSGIRELTIADYLTIVLRYKWLIVAMTIVVAAAAYFWTLRYPPYYKATSEVYLNTQNPDLTSSITGITSNNTVTDPERNANTQAQIARVPAVADLAIQLSGLKGIGGGLLLTHSHVTPGNGTDLLTFTVTHGDPTVAATLATAYARAFSRYKLQMDTASLSRARNDLQRRLAQLRRAGADGTDTYRQLSQKAQDLTTLEQLQAPASVVRAPTGAAEIAPVPMHRAILGGVLGLMLGLGGAFLLNAFDRRVRDVDEIERELDIPLLGRLPVPQGRSDMYTILDGRPDAMSEAVSRLRTNFDFANAELQAKVVMATSAGAEEGKSTTVSNLAIALARSGRRVVLVDLDIRRPSLARMFRLQDRAGLTDAVVGNVDLRTVLHTVNYTALSSRLRPRGEGSSGVLEVVTAGRARIDPAELVEAPGLAGLLQRLRERAEIVLLDAPPILITGDAMALTGKVDAVLLVTRLGTVKLPALRELARALGRSPGPVLGFVATAANIDESYLTYGLEGVPTVVEAGAVRATDSAAVQDISAPRSVSAGGGRWTRQPNS